jgi:hypothetical protein
VNRTVSWAIAAAALLLLGWALWSSREAGVGAGDGVRGQFTEFASKSAASGALTSSGAGPSLPDDNRPAVSALRADVAPAAPAASIAGRSVEVGPGTGPQPLTPRNEARLEAFVALIAKSDGRSRDFTVLAETEASDPDWSDAMERQLQRAIAIRGGEFTGIQTRPPHCTRSVCMLVATGAIGTEVTNADWQRLMGMVMNEPWFGGNFFDTQTSVHTDAQGTKYVTFFIRKR